MDKNQTKKKKEQCATSDGEEAGYGSRLKQTFPEDDLGTDLHFPLLQNRRLSFIAMGIPEIHTLPNQELRHSTVGGT